MQKVLLASSIFFFAGLAQAQEAITPPRSNAEAPNNAVGVHLGPGLTGAAGVGFSTIYNSNFYLSESNPESSYGFVLTPSVILQRKGPKLTFEIGASVETAKYTAVHIGPDSYLDGAIAGKLDWAAMTRHHFTLDYNTSYGHDPFGSFRTENNIPLDQGLDKWLQSAVNGTYRYGAPGALINLVTEAGWMGRAYQTNRTQTQFLDFKSWEIGEIVYFNVSSKTSLLAEVLRSDTTYDENPAATPNRDYQTTHYRVGMHWLATSTTSGDVRIGRMRRDFDDPAQATTNQLDWTASVTWAPVVYSIFSVQTGVQSQQSYLAGVQLIQNRFGLITWTHQFSNYFRTSLSYSHVGSDFVGSSRVDRIDTFGLEGNYAFSKRWLGVAGASYSRRDSNQAELDYGDTAVYLGIRYGR